MPAGRLGAVGSRALALAAGLVLAAAVGELGLRVARPQAAGLSHQPLVYRRDDALGYRYVPGARGHIERLFEVDNEVRINGRGFHDVERPAPPPEARVRPVAVAGDSFTAALQLPVADGWTQVLERELRERLGAGAAPSVYNLGLDGTGSDVHVALLREALPELRPQAVLVAFYANDVADVATGRVYREVRGRYVIQPRSDAQARAMRALAERLSRRRLANALFDHSYLVRFGVYLLRGDRNLFRYNVISPADVGAPAPRAAADEEALHRIFGDLARVARERGVAAWVVPVPARDDPDASLRTFRRYATPSEVGVLDVLPVLRQRLARDGRRHRDLFFRRDGHLNAYGNRAFGDAVAELLAPHIAPPGRGAEG